MLKEDSYTPGPPTSLQDKGTEGIGLVLAAATVDHDYYAIVQHRPLDVIGQGSQPGVELYWVAAAVLSRLKVGGLGAAESRGQRGSGKGEGYNPGRRSLQDHAAIGDTGHPWTISMPYYTTCGCNCARNGHHCTMQYLFDVFVCGLRTNMFGCIQKGLYTGLSTTVRVCAVQGTLSR